MKTTSVALFAASIFQGQVLSFQGTSSSARVGSHSALFGYVPDGFTKESYAKFKEEERKKQAKGNLGAVGPRGFKSRSMSSFIEAYERGETPHLFPMENAKEKLAKGEIKMEDIPYMQRVGGQWDNSDVKGAKKLRWLQSDKKYEAYGEKRAQSFSILGVGKGLDWTGSRDREGPPQPVRKLDKNYKPPSIYDDSKSTTSKKTSEPAAEDRQQQPKKKLFGLF
jgi:hypothetical protein